MFKENKTNEKTRQLITQKKKLHKKNYFLDQY